MKYLEKICTHNIIIVILVRNNFLFHNLQV